MPPLFCIIIIINTLYSSLLPLCNCEASFVQSQNKGRCPIIFGRVTKKVEPNPKLFLIICINLICIKYINIDLLWYLMRNARGITNSDKIIFTSFSSQLAKLEISCHWTVVKKKSDACVVATAMIPGTVFWWRSRAVMLHKWDSSGLYMSKR